MVSHSTVFAFEADFAGALYCVPMCVRLKLDCAGVKLSLAQWNRLPLEARNRFVSQPCEAQAAVRAYRQAVIDALGSATGEQARDLPVEAQPDWADAGRVPAQLADHLRALDLPELCVAQWAALVPLQRFTLLKLSRPGHSNENFLPALREFGLSPAQ